MAIPPFEVEVVYAKEETEWMLPVVLQKPSSIAQAIDASGILLRCPEIDLKVQKVGIFGVIKPMSTLLQPFDRVEIYRAITVDPMEQRRQRVKAGQRSCR